MTALKAAQKVWTSLTPGQRHSLGIVRSMLPVGPEQSGTRSVDVRDFLRSQLQHFLSKPRMPDGPPVTAVYLCNHLAMLCRMKRQYHKLSRPKIYKLVMELSSHQFSLHCP